MKKAILLVLFLFVITYGNINKLNGQADFVIDLGPFAKLHYKGGVEGDVLRPNEQSPAGIVGLGWRFGTPYISVDHKFTVDIGDDRWYWHDGYGNSDEIIRFLDGGEEKFYLQNSPEKAVKAFKDEGGDHEIYRWEIYEIDGTINRFGRVDDEEDDAILRLPAWGNKIGKGIKESTPALSFNYHWSLKVIEDVNGQKTRFNYKAEEDIRTTTTGYDYTVKSPISSIETPIGERVEFEYDEIDFSSNEGRFEPNLNDFDFMPKKYLTKITHRNKYDILLADANLKYSGDPGQVQHVHHDKKGFAKRLLTRIESTTKNEFNYRFGYTLSHPISQQLGFLTTISDFKGNTIDYKYEIFVSKNFEEFSTFLDADKWDSFVMETNENHILLKEKFPNQKPYEPGELKFYLYDNAQGQWKKSIIATENMKITGEKFDHAYAKITGDLLVFWWERIFIRSLYFYRWIDDHWELCHFTHDADEDVMEVREEYVVTKSIRGPDKINIYYRPSNSYEYIKTSFEINSEKAADPRFATAKDYFILGYKSGSDMRGKIYRFNGSAWSAEPSVKLVPIGQNDEEFKLQAFDDYYIASILKFVEAGDVDYYKTPYVIRRWNYVENTWQDETISGYSNVLPIETEIAGSNDYLVLIDTDDWMNIYRYQRDDNGDYSWNETFVEGSSGSHIDEENRIWCKHMKNIRRQTNMFMVASTLSDETLIGCFRWIGDDASGHWESVLEDYFAQQQNPYGYGMVVKKVEYKYIDEGINLNNETFSAQFEKTGNDKSHFYLGSFDYFNNEFDHAASHELPLDRTGNENSILQDNYLAILNSDFVDCNNEYQAGANTYLLISKRCKHDWNQAIFSRVRRVTSNNGVDNSVSVTFDYEDNNSIQLVNQNNLTRYYSLVSEINDGIPDCKTTTEYCIDSTTGIFGHVFATTMHKIGSGTTPDNDTIRISGWLMEKDGYTPAMGWMRIRLATSQLPPED